MKSLVKFFEDYGIASPPPDGMGAVTFPDVATGVKDFFDPAYKHGSGDVPGGFTKKKKKDYKKLLQKLRERRGELNERIQSVFESCNDDHISDFINLMNICDGFYNAANHWLKLNAHTTQSKRIYDVLVRLENNIHVFAQLLTNNHADSLKTELDLDVDKLPGKKLGSVLKSFDEWKELQLLVSTMQNPFECSADMTKKILATLIISDSISLVDELTQ